MASKTFHCFDKEILNKDKLWHAAKSELDFDVSGILRVNKASSMHDYKSYKVYIRGDEGVGKTMTMLNLCDVNYNHEFPCDFPGILVNHVQFPCHHIDGRKFTFHLEFWDASENSTRKYPHLLHSMRENADGVLHVFSLASRASFDGLPQRITEETRAFCDASGEPRTPLPYFLLGTKWDDVLHRQVSLQLLHWMEQSQRQKVHKISNWPDPGYRDLVNTFQQRYILTCIAETLWLRSQS